MATVKFAPHISEIHGSIQNATYSRNRLGPFIKLKRVGIDRRTATQISRRQFHAAAVYAWHNTLSQLQIDAWNDLALTTTFYNKASIAYHPSGFNIFIRMFTFTRGQSSTIDIDAPTTAAAAPPDLQISISSAGVISAYALNSWQDGKTGYLKTFASPALPSGRQTFSGSWFASAWTDLSTIPDIGSWVQIGTCEAYENPFRATIQCKAFYDSGSGHVVTWPLVRNLPYPGAP